MSKEYILVTTISHFRLKYAIPAKEFEALGYSEPINQEKLSAYLSTGHVKEFSQFHLSENVCDVTVHNEQDMLKIFDEDNAYLSSWPTEQKIDWIQRWEEDIG
jgi:hypothetical protein